MRRASARSTALAALYALLALGTPATPCPAACGSRIPQDWTVYASFDRLSFCPEPILFDFAIHTPVNDLSKTLKFRACTPEDDWDTITKAKVSTQHAVSQKAAGATFEDMGVYVQTALTHVRDYLNAGTDCTKNVMLGYNKGAVAGVHAAKHLEKDSPDWNWHDGIDFDWEYPGAPDIPGIPPGLKSDTLNYLATLKALREELPDEYSISIEAPASYWYLKAFPISEIARCQWDYENMYSQSGCPNGDCLRSHVTETEVRLALSISLFWPNIAANSFSEDLLMQYPTVTKAGVNSNKIMVGESSYGRFFKMVEAGCTGPMCLYTSTDGESDAKPGRCTNTGGYIADAEFKEIIRKGDDSIKTWYDNETASDYMVYNSLQDFSVADTVGPSGDYNKSSCINVFDNMTWNWANPVIDAPVDCTNIIQASPLGTTVTRTAYSSLSLVSGDSLSTTVVSTVFSISEVNYQPFTIACTDTESGTVLTYTPVPRLTLDPIGITIPKGWTITSPSGEVDGPSSTTSLVGFPASTYFPVTTTTTTSTDENGVFLFHLTWEPTIS
ncbi:hypothetical protein BDW69DRAFT_186264 [Aspergillus filifer]